eukprot:m.229790 g.229790  ORF g.229790 m.229790 type:complete len:535 (+) comp11956_c0_seq1:1014-2618(+)
MPQSIAARSMAVTSSSSSCTRRRSMYLRRSWFSSLRSAFLLSTASICLCNSAFFLSIPASRWASCPRCKSSTLASSSFCAATAASRCSLASRASVRSRRASSCSLVSCCSLSRSRPLSFFDCSASSCSWASSRAADSCPRRRCRLAFSRMSSRSRSRSSSTIRSSSFVRSWMPSSMLGADAADAAGTSTMSSSAGECVLAVFTDETLARGLGGTRRRADPSLAREAPRTRGGSGSGSSTTEADASEAPDFIRLARWPPDGPDGGSEEVVEVARRAGDSCSPRAAWLRFETLPDALDAATNVLGAGVGSALRLPVEPWYEPPPPSCSEPASAGSILSGSKSSTEFSLLALTRRPPKVPASRSSSSTCLAGRLSTGTFFASERLAGTYDETLAVSSSSRTAEAFFMRPPSSTGASSSTFAAEAFFRRPPKSPGKAPSSSSSGEGAFFGEVIRPPKLPGPSSSSSAGLRVAGLIRPPKLPGPSSSSSALATLAFLIRPPKLPGPSSSSCAFIEGLDTRPPKSPGPSSSSTAGGGPFF